MAYQPIVQPLPIIAANTDVFGNQKVSAYVTQLDVKFTQDDSPLLVDYITSGTGAVSRVAAKASMELTTAAASDYVIMKSFQSLAYFSGKGAKLIETFAKFNSQTNVTKRIGYFTSTTVAPYDSGRDGLWLESDGSDVYVVTAVNGTEVKVASGSWDDPLDGTGASGKTVDWTKSQILQVDFGWLGYNVVQWCIVIDGELIMFHESKHANVIDAPYMSQSNHPMRWEIRQTGAGSGIMQVTCSTFGSQGGADDIGKVLSANNGSTFVNANVVGTRYACLGLRLKSTALNTLINLIDTTQLAQTADDWLFEIIINPTVAGTFTYNGITNSALEVANGVTANTVSGGTVLASGYGAASFAGGTLAASLENAIRLGSAIDGTQDEIVLSIMPLSSNLDIFTSLTWREFN